MKTITTTTMSLCLGMNERVSASIYAVCESVKKIVYAQFGISFAAFVVRVEVKIRNLKI